MLSNIKEVVSIAIERSTLQLCVFPLTIIVKLEIPIYSYQGIQIAICKEYDGRKQDSFYQGCLE